MGGVPRAGERVGGGERPLRRRRRRARACASRRSAPARSRRRSSTIQSSAVSSSCSSTSAREQRVVPEAAQEARRADHLLAAVHRRLDAEAPSRSRALERLVELAARPDTTARAARAAAPPARPGRGGGTAASPRAREVLARHVERPPQRLAAPDRDDLCAGRERVQPLGRRGEAGADDRHARRVRRAARTSGRRAGRRAAPPGRSGPDGRARAARAGRRRRPSSSKPPSTARTRSTRACVEAPVPAAPLAQLLDVREELLDRRVVAVEQRRDERPRERRRDAARTASPGNDVGEAVPVALGAHLALPDRRCPPRQAAAGSASVPKTAISSGASRRGAGSGTR